jgi:hypothetical protein
MTSKPDRAPFPEVCYEHADRLTRIETLMESMRDDYLEGIKEQTERTNGRVTQLEARVNTLSNTATRNRTLISIMWAIFGGMAGAYGAVLAGHILGVK